MPEDLYPLRLSGAVLLSYLIVTLLPGAQPLGAGVSAIGFWRDFALDQPLDESLIPLIEEKWRGLVKEHLTFELREMMRENAAERFRHHQLPLTGEYLLAYPDNIAPCVQIENYYDFPGLPIAKEDLLPSTEQFGPMKILSISPQQIYLEQEGKLPVLRIEAATFPNPQSLKKFAKTYEKAKRAEHVLLGREMKLFSPASEDLSSWFWCPKGVALRQTLIQFWQNKMTQAGFKFLLPPAFTLKEQDPCFFWEGTPYSWNTNHLKEHLSCFQLDREAGHPLPCRYAVQNQTFMPVSTQTLCGLLHTRDLLQDNWSIFCSPQQLIEELISSLQFIDEIVKILGLEYYWILGASRVRSKTNVDYLEKALRNANISYTEDSRSSTANPYIAVGLLDGFGRSWKGPELSIASFDPQQRSWLTSDRQGVGSNTAVISGTLFRSLERMIALLIERYAGEFPLWLAPEQVRLLPVRMKNTASALSTQAQLRAAGFRVEVDTRDDTLDGKVHAAEKERVPYMVIMGDREENKSVLTVRSHAKKETGCSMDLEQFISQLQRESNIPQAMPK